MNNLLPIHLLKKNIFLTLMLCMLGMTKTHAQNNTLSTGQLGQTFYDYQTNAGARTWTHVWPDGKVSFAFTMALEESPYLDRGTGIGTYDSANDVWIPSQGRVENEKTGWGSIAQYGANGIVVVAHNSVGSSVYIISDKDDIEPGSVGRVGTLDPTNDPYWPNVMTSGTNRDIIHVIATGSEDNREYYYRSTDGGQTWDKENVVLPFMGPEDCPYFTSNSCYWMETTGDNCLALVVNSPWSDGMVLYSYDDGETWERKVFYRHPDPFGHFDDPVYYPRWTSCQWDRQHRLHVLYEFGAVTGEAGGGNYEEHTDLGGVAYWNEAMPYNAGGATVSAFEGNLVPGQPFVMETSYLENDIYRSWWHFSDATHEMWPEYIGYLAPLTDGGVPEDPYQATGFNIEDLSLHGFYHSGVCSFPVLCTVPDSDEMVAVWSALDENHMDGNGNYYYKIFASYSSDAGATWSPMVHLTDNPLLDNAEFVYNQAAVVGRKLVIATQTDGECGTYLRGETDFDGSDNYYMGMVFDIDDLFNTIPPEEFTISVAADPSNMGSVIGGGTYYEGSTCVLRAVPNAGYAFSHWTNNGDVVSLDPVYSFVVNGDAEYVAHFSDGYTVTVMANPEEGGTISGSGIYVIGRTCTLTATANVGYAFANWTTASGTVVSSDAEYSFTVEGDVTYVANFTALPSYQIVVVVNPTHGGTVSGDGTYYEGSECVLTANAYLGYVFSEWTTEGGEVVSTDPTFVFTVTGDALYIANFVGFGGFLGQTFYDYQTNAGARTWTHVWPDGKVSFAFTMALEESPYLDRGTGIGTYDSANDVWIPSQGRVENEKTGWGSIAQYGANGIVVVAHNSVGSSVYIISDKDDIEPGSVGRVGTLDPTNDPYWPNVMTSGTNRDIIHVIATGSEDNREYYYRSTDGGQTWDKENVVLPFMGPEDCPYFTSNSCYWMETTGDNCLALVVNSPWSDGMVLYSYDDGETWERKVFYRHPDPFGHFDDPVYYPRWTSCQWDRQHRLHVLYEFGAVTGEAGGGNYEEHTDLGGVAYWNEAMPYNAGGATVSAFEGNLVPGQPFVMETSYLENDIYRSWWHFSDATHEMWPEYIGYLAPLTDGGVPEDPYQATGFNIEDLSLHGFYHSGVCSFPVLCTVPDSDEMVAVWSALDENHMDGNGNYYYKIFASYSSDAGATWSPMVHLTDNPLLDNAEFVYNQAAVVGRKLVIATQTDGECGTYLRGETDFDGSDNYYMGMVFDIDDLFGPSYSVQSIALSAGANWFSTNVEITLADLQNALKATLGNNASITIKSQTQSCQLKRGSWTGSLTSMDVALMYKIVVDAACEFTLEGAPINPAEHPITINPGATVWIGYPLSEGMAVADAFTSSFIVNSDQLKSQTLSTQVKRGNWNGQLNILEPGQGYIFKSASTETRTFTFPSGSK